MLMSEFGLSEAELSGGDWHIAFRKHTTKVVTSEAIAVESGDDAGVVAAPAAPSAQAGTPVSSPMTGIFYAAPSPNAPTFVKEGDAVTAGEVVGLIEAMKVFNEIIATTSGKVLKVVAESGQLVNPGDVLVLIG